jgi:L-amino acid N-acyltransferase YncA
MVKTRPIALSDAKATRAIYNLEVLESTVTFDMVPRTPEAQVLWIEQHLGGHPAIVAVDDDDKLVLGFASLSPFRSRAAYSPTVEDSVYVHRDARGHGVGELLLREILAAGTHHGFHSVMARIVGGHDASIALHRKCGFQEIGREREVGRKCGKWLDVVLMQLMLQETEPYSG